MNRKHVLEQIQAEYATHGICTEKAIQLYTDHRIGYTEYMDAANRGLEIYTANAPCVESFQGVVDRALKPARPFEEVAEELGI